METGCRVDSDAFEILGLEPSFDVTRAAIESAYLSRIAGAHPDLGDDREADAAGLNDARRALINDERRANLALCALGGASAGEDATLPEGFLFEIMDVRTEIESALESGDEGERARQGAWAAGERARYREVVSGLFERVGEEGADKGELLAEIRRVLNAWRYIERLIEQLEPGYDPGRADFL